MRIYMKILILVLIMSLTVKIVSSCVHRCSISIKSITFDHSDESSLVLGNKNVQIPSLGDGIYAVSLKRTLSGIKNRIMYIGVLQVISFQDQIHKMDEFFKQSIYDNFTHISLFAVGSTHQKPVLEILRTGISTGALDDMLDIFKAYGITKFTGFSHGVRKPYIFIKNLESNHIIERTGSSGGRLIANM